MFEENFTLKGPLVTLRIITNQDIEPLASLSKDAGVFTYFTSNLAREEDLANWVTHSLQQFSRHERVPFVITETATGKPIGCTSFGNISLPDKRLEIGWTWLGKPYQGKGYNRPCKFLLLSYAFETLGLERVEFKADVLNTPSRKALKKIGATEEGILRSHTVMPGNRRRDTIYYSILRHEWPEVKERVFGDLL